MGIPFNNTLSDRKLHLAAPQKDREQKMLVLLRRKQLGCLLLWHLGVTIWLLELFLETAPE